MTAAPASPGGLDVLRGASSVLLAHAHPDDETLDTGALIASLVRDGVACTVVTATRGERGEVVPGSVPADENRPLDDVRADELASALRTLGVGGPVHLGSGIARAAGAAERTYRDSGMRWIRPGLAGPTDETEAGTLTGAPLARAVADLVAAIRATGADCVLSYADDGGYGHPDHVRTHHIARRAAAETGTAFLVHVPAVRHLAGGDDPPRTPPAGDDAEWVDLPGVHGAVDAALRGYATQFTVLDSDASAPGRFRVRHVGGQHQDRWCRIGLRRAD